MTINPFRHVALEIEVPMLDGRYVSVKFMPSGALVVDSVLLVGCRDDTIKLRDAITELLGAAA